VPQSDDFSSVTAPSEIDEYPPSPQLSSDHQLPRTPQRLDNELPRMPTPPNPGRHSVFFEPATSPTQPLPTHTSPHTPCPEMNFSSRRNLPKDSSGSPGGEDCVETRSCSPRPSFAHTGSTSSPTAENTSFHRKNLHLDRDFHLYLNGLCLLFLNSRLLTYSIRSSMR
jgi:hypothetical protein